MVRSGFCASIHRPPSSVNASQSIGDGHPTGCLSGSDRIVG
jgi:hypothetical protein